MAVAQRLKPSRASTTWFQTSRYCRAKVEFNSINWVRHGSSTTFETCLSRKGKEFPSAISKWILISLLWIQTLITERSGPESSITMHKNRLIPEIRKYIIVPNCMTVTRLQRTIIQGCALRKISGSPSGSQAFYLSRPGLKVGRPAKNFGEPVGLPSIPAGAPRPLKLVARVHVMRKYFVRTRILLACWSPNSVILAFGFDQNPHVLLWNPSKFLCHSDLKPETSNVAELFRF